MNFINHPPPPKKKKNITQAVKRGNIEPSHTVLCGKCKTKVRKKG